MEDCEVGGRFQDQLEIAHRRSNPLSKPPLAIHVGQSFHIREARGMIKAGGQPAAKPVKKQIALDMYVK